MKTTSVYQLMVREEITWADGSKVYSDRNFTTVARDLPEALHLVRHSRLGPRGDGSSVTDVAFQRAEYVGKVDFAA